MYVSNGSRLPSNALSSSGPAIASVSYTGTGIFLFQTWSRQFYISIPEQQNPRFYIAGEMEFHLLDRLLFPFFHIVC